MNRIICSGNIISGDFFAGRTVAALKKELRNEIGISRSSMVARITSVPQKVSDSYVVSPGDILHLSPIFIGNETKGSIADLRKKIAFDVYAVQKRKNVNGNYKLKKDESLEFIKTAGKISPVRKPRRVRSPQ